MKSKTRQLERRYRRLKTTDAEQAWRQQFQLQRCTFQQKACDYWSSAVADCKDDPRALWAKLNNILSPSISPTSDRLSADDFAAHFTSKIQSIRDSTASATLPSIVERAGARLSSLSPVTVQEVTKLLGKLPAKHCSLDPVSTWLVKRLTVYLAPVICQLCNASLQSCRLPASQKHAVVQPRLKRRR